MALEHSWREVYVERWIEGLLLMLLTVLRLKNYVQTWLFLFHLQVVLVEFLVSVDLRTALHHFGKDKLDLIIPINNILTLFKVKI